MAWPANGTENWNDTMKAHVEVSLASDGKVKDGAVFSTSAAPTVDAGVANKKYVDDTGEGVTPTTDDSEANAMLKSHAYLTQVSGYANAYVDAGAGNQLKGFIGSSSDPAGAGTQVALSGGSAGDSTNISLFVPKGRYFEITVTGDTPTIIWTSLNSSGGSPIDQD